MRVVKSAPEPWETATSLLQKSLTAPHPRLRERWLALALIMGGPARPSTLPSKWAGAGGRWRTGSAASMPTGWPGCTPRFVGSRAPGSPLQSWRSGRPRSSGPRAKSGLRPAPWTGKVVAAFVKRAFGKTISAATARRYLHRLGFGRKRPRKRFVRAKPAAQRAFAQALAAGWSSSASRAV